MSKIFDQFITVCRPVGEPGRGDKYLVQHAQDLRRIIGRALRDRPQQALAGDSQLLDQITFLLVEMAEDLHNDIGLWRTVEGVNLERYGTPLPFLIPPGDPAPAGFDSRRFQYCLYVLLRHILMFDEFVPGSPDLQEIGEHAAKYFNDRFTGMPKDSGVKRFLGLPNDSYGRVRAKLRWFMGASYPIRFLSFLVLRDKLFTEAGKELLDRLAVSIHTPWTGLTAAGLLAKLLSLEPDRRLDILSWNQSLSCFGRSVSTRPVDGMHREETLFNVLNGRECSGLLAKDATQLPPDKMLRGSLLRWNGQSYWHHLVMLTDLRTDSAKVVEKMRLECLLDQQASLFVLFPEIRDRVVSAVGSFHEQFVSRYGGNLVTLASGKEATELWLEQQRSVASEAALSPFEDAARILSEDLVNDLGPIGVFSDPERGLSFVRNFNQTLAALRKDRAEMSPEEIRLIRSLLLDSKISPGLIKRLVQEHGSKGVLTALGAPDEPAPFALDWLLDAYKGMYARPGYLPNLAPLPAMLAGSSSDDHPPASSSA